MMGDNGQQMIERIHQSIREASKDLPAYGQILPFFGSVFILQEEALAGVAPEAFQIPPGLLQSKMEANFPVLDRHRISMDLPAAAKLLKALCTEAENANLEMATAAETLLSCLEDGEDTVYRGFKMCAAGDLDGLQNLGTEIGIKEDMLVFFLHNSILPSMAWHAKSISPQLDIDGPWQKGCCPICGSMPNLSFLSDTGRRFLICSFCRHQWPIKRILCPRCDSSDTDTIGYFYNEEENAYRVYTCDACKTYIKTVDTRSLPHTFFPPLANIITTHLDMQAREMGYREMTPFDMPV